MNYPQVASLNTAEAFKNRTDELGIELPLDEEIATGSESPLAQRRVLRTGSAIGNRFAVLPMEGWDGTDDGRPTALTTRRWTNFGRSGAKLIWGGEAVAVRQDGRANPHQLLMSEASWEEIARLREALVAAHEDRFGDSSDLLVGLQLTHAGRFSRPNAGGRPEPKILYRHPVLDRRFSTPDDLPVLTDDEIVVLVDDFVAAARLARRAGFHFVDIKHCHGYLGHEFLSAATRGGRYGGSLANRTRFLREIVAGIRAEAPGLEIGVRVSAFDLLPFRSNGTGPGVPEAFDGDHYPFAFGGDNTGLGIDLSEPREFLDLLLSLDIELVCLSAGSPYYNPHIIRPALFPPSDGYEPPEDPLRGVARLIKVTAELKRHRPELVIVGSGYSYLQEWLPHVAQHVVRTGQADMVGLGRMMLSYPEFPADVIGGRTLERRRICRTLSDCTTAPRNGLVSGCYPLDRFYRERPEARIVASIKKGTRRLR